MTKIRGIIKRAYRNKQLTEHDKWFNVYILLCAALWSEYLAF